MIWLGGAKLLLNCWLYSESVTQARLSCCSTGGCKCQNKTHIVTHGGGGLRVCLCVGLLEFTSLSMLTALNLFVCVSIRLDIRS